MDHFASPEGKLGCLLTLWGRLVDDHLAQEAIDRLDEESQRAFWCTVGVQGRFNPLTPDGFYALDLADPEQRL